MHSDFLGGGEFHLLLGLAVDSTSSFGHYVDDDLVELGEMYGVDDQLEISWLALESCWKWKWKFWRAWENLGSATRLSFCLPRCDDASLNFSARQFSGWTILSQTPLLQTFAFSLRYFC